MPLDDQPVVRECRGIDALGVYPDIGWVRDASYVRFDARAPVTFGCHFAIQLLARVVRCRMCRESATCLRLDRVSHRAFGTGLRAH